LEGVRGPPRAPVAFIVMLALLAGAGLATGIEDVAIPSLTGKPLFEGLREIVERGGPLGYAYLFLHILIHNLGIACLVPGVGFIAAHFEKCPEKRRLIGPILGAGVLLAMSTASLWVIMEGVYSSTAILVFFALECAGVLLLTWAGMRALRGYVPTRKWGWSLFEPASRLAPVFLAAGILIALAAFIEVIYVARLSA